MAWHGKAWHDKASGACAGRHSVYIHRVSGLAFGTVCATIANMSTAECEYSSVSVTVSQFSAAHARSKHCHSGPYASMRHPSHPPTAKPPQTTARHHRGSRALARPMSQTKRTKRSARERASEMSGARRSTHASQPVALVHRLRLGSAGAESNGHVDSYPFVLEGLCSTPSV